MEQIDSRKRMKHGLKESEASALRANDVKKRLFLYRPLLDLEMLIYGSFVACTIIYMWYKVYEVSSAYQWTRQRMNFEWTENWPLAAGLKDVSHEAWREWCRAARKTLPFYIAHSVLFNFRPKILPPSIWSGAMLIFWTCSLSFINGLSTVVCTATFGFILYAIAKLSRNCHLMWIVTSGFLYIVIQHPEKIFHEDDHAVWSSRTWFCTYAAVHFISCCLDSINLNLFSNSSFIEGAYSMLWYSFYLPYNVTLIVPFKDFTQQLKQREEVLRNRSFQSVVLFGLRICFWYIVIEVGLHFFYFTAISGDTEFLEGLPRDSLCAIGGAMGQFFHLTFVVICGMNAFFAHMDGMQPMALPICVSRVILYSKIWRNFDRGLYLFFKEYIIYPICKPTFSIFRRLLAMLMCFSFVFLWHGLLHSTLVWVILNIIETLLEATCKAIYIIPAVKQWRGRHISDEAFRRVLALLYTIPYSLSLYSNFYFLSSSEAASVYVNKLFMEDTLKLKYPFLIILFLGYCYGNLIIELDGYLEQKISDKQVVETNGDHLFDRLRNRMKWW